MSAAIHIRYAQFEEIARRGDFEGVDDRYELLFGKVVPVPQPGPAHDNLVEKLAAWSYRSLPEDARIRSQSSLGMPNLESLSFPDVSWLRDRDYSENRPQPEDVLLVIEVSDGMLSRDSILKASLYAQAGITDYWIVNVAARTVEIRRNPDGDNYRSVEVLCAGGEARPLAYPDVVLPVSRLFPD